MRGIVGDISSYQPNFNFQLFKDLGGTAVVIKSSMQLGFDPKLFESMSRAKQAGLLTGIYHWVDPIPNSINKQVDLFSEAIQRTNPDFLAGDVEQWWSDWGAFNDYCNRKISVSQVPRLSDKKISDFTKAWFHAITRNYPNKRLLLYSGYWFSGYSPSMKKWVEDFAYWGADYRKYPKKIMTYPEVEEWAQGIENLKMFPGTKQSILHQFTSSVLIPGLNVDWGRDKQVDLNVTINSKEEFIDWVRGTPLPVQEDEERVKIKSWVSRLRIRPEPNLNKKEICWLEKNQIETIAPSLTTGSWLKLKFRDGYIHKDYIDYL